MSFVDASIVLPDGSQRRVHLAAGGKVLSDLLRQAGIPLNTRCGNRGICDGCTVEWIKGSQTTMIRACEKRIEPGQSIHLRVPARSGLHYRPQVVTDYRVNISCGHDPLYPAQDGEPLGVAVDIGTTTVALLLVDLRSGKVLAQASAFNEQMHLGDDVITRIQLCTNDKAMIRELQRAAADRTIRRLLQTALEAANVPAVRVRCFSFAGNTTMLHLVCGTDPTPMGYAPFTPEFLDHQIHTAGEIFTDLNGVPADVSVHLLPGAAAYVGSDLTAGAVATGLIYDDGPSLLVDAGTNGEILFKHGEVLLGCATAAGPAFEGAGLTCGIRAGDGAISHIGFTTPSPGTPAFGSEAQARRGEGRGEGPRLITEMIGTGRPIGICGSAYVDFLAEARRIELVSEVGRFNGAQSNHLEILSAESSGHTDRALKIATAAGGQTISISQRDIASLMQAKAAIAAGILTLLSHTHVKPADVKTVYLAGGFGTKMNVANAIACGMLPGFRPEQVQPVGNTALAGAYLALMDQSLLAEMSRAGRRTRIIELNLDPNFESTYIDQLKLGGNYDQP